MTFSQGSRSQLTIVAETTPGTTPGSPTMKTIPINTHSLTGKKTIIESDEIRSDRQVAVSRHGNKFAEGNVEVEFRADDYDDFLESALFGAFSSNVLKLGTTLKTMTMEDGALDISEYRVFKGCAVNTFSLDVRPDAIAKATFGIIGMNAIANSSSSLDASPDAASGNVPFDSFTGVITENSSSLAIVTGLKLDIANGINPTKIIGSDSSPQLEYGRGRVSGELTCYYEDSTLIDKFINETSSDLVFSLTDGLTGNTYTFDLPNIKYNGADAPLANEQSRIITLPFQALYDATDDTTLSITKS